MTGPAGATRVDPLLVREVLGHHPTGVSVVTAVADDGEAVAMVVGTFTSVSLDPLLVAFLPERRSYVFGRLRTARVFAVNVLAHDQEDLCRRLVAPIPDKLAGEKWRLSAAGAPVLDGVVASVDCRFHDVLDAGDHHIVLGAVLDLQIHRPATPLVFFQGGFGGFAPRATLVPGDRQLVAATARAQTLQPDLERLAAELGGEVTVFARVEDDAVAVAVARPPGGRLLTPLGARHPLIPPLGVPLVAWSDAADQEAWIGRAPGVSPEEEARYRGRLAAARRRGWSLSLDAPGRSETLEAAVDEYGRGTPLPARGRVLSRQIAGSSRYFDVDDLDPERDYAVAAVMAPVLDAGGRAPLMLRLFFPPAPAPGRLVRTWGERLAEYGRHARTRHPERT